MATIVGMSLASAGMAWFFVAPYALSWLPFAPPLIDPGLAPLLGIPAVLAGSLIASVGRQRSQGGGGPDVAITINMPSFVRRPSRVPPADGIILPSPDGSAEEPARFADALSRMPDDSLRSLARAVANTPERTHIVAGLEWARNQAPTPEARAQIQRLLDLLS